MPVIKCKMCGGDLNIVDGSTVCECEYCGTKQTVPKVDDEKKLKLFSRAGKLLRNCEFDKASGAFESIIADFPEEAEAYWGLVLCKYGIEYVDDPTTGKKVPTCHRSSFESVEDDSNFEQACENADAIARRVYREEARQIESLRKRILEVSGKEEPYDVFISYKELDEDGDRTPDSVIAQDIYRALTKEGYRVFFSRISLEGKLGVEYEPYIFAAINSAKIMIVVGTDYEYFDAVWVKNEWSRFLKLIASGQQKTVIPVYKDMDPYDMPKELRALAAQNMGKIGAMQDLLHGVDKLLGKKDAASAQPAPQQDSGMSALNAQSSAMLKRGYMMLKDGDYAKADDFFERVLNNDAECGQAYWGKALATAKVPDAAQYGSVYLFNRLKKQADVRTLTVNLRSISTLAREADESNILKDFSDRELDELLKDLRSEPVQIQTAAQYYEAQSKLMTGPAYPHKLADSHDFDRAAQYADDVVQQAEQSVLQNLKAKTEKAAAEERAIEADAKQVAERKEKQAVSIIKNRLAAVAAEYEKQRQALETARREADRKAEAAYQAALKKFEQDYQAAIVAQNDAYHQNVKSWEQRKAAYESGHDAAVAERERLKEKIAQLTVEKNNLKGLFTGKRRKELEDYIALLNKELSETHVPEEPGTRPAKPSPLKKGDPPKKESFKVAAAGNKAANMRELIKCSLSPAYSAYRQIIKNLKASAPGDEIQFGTYPTQEGKLAPIIWKVLAKENGRLLVITKEGVDCQQYNTSRTSVTWENCTLRKWLNDTFLNAAFSKVEQAMIPTVTVSADKNPDYSTSPGNSTKDQVLLLSIPEVKRYFSSDEARKCAQTAYAIAQGSWTGDAYSVCGKDTCWWWLRSPGVDSSSAAGIYRGGSVDSRGIPVDYDHVAVRPALWINLEF